MLSCEETRIVMTGVVITSVMISQPWNITAIAASHINMKYSGDETADSAVNDPLLKQREGGDEEEEPVVSPDSIIISRLEH